MSGIIATYVDPGIFKVSGDLTDVLVEGRRIRADCGVDGFKFGTIESSSYDDGDDDTTINLTSTSNSLTSNLDVIWYGIIGGDNQAMPTHSHDGSEGSGGELVFGREFQQESSEGISTTSSIDWQQKLRLTISNAPSGTYRIGWYMELYEDSFSMASQDSIAKVELNDTTVLGEFENTINFDFPSYVFSGVSYQSLSGNNNIDVDYKSAMGSSGTSIKRARLEVWRIS
jgi:hypothetical protein